jgi:hypothetical protein
MHHRRRRKNALATTERSKMPTSPAVDAIMGRMAEINAGLARIESSGAIRSEREQRLADAHARVAYERDKRDIQRWRNDDANAEEDRRRDARRNDELCAKHRRAYDDAFQAFGKRAPEPLAGQSAYDYRRDLFRHAQDMLPSNHPLVGVNASEIAGDAMPPMQQQLLGDLGKEAENPSGDNLPEDPDDPRAKRVSYDDSMGPGIGRPVVSYKARRSFIYNLSRPGGRVWKLGPMNNSGVTTPGMIFQGR